MVRFNGRDTHPTLCWAASMSYSSGRMVDDAVDYMGLLNGL